MNATRTSGGKTVSNIRWSYGQQSVPRPYRDVIVTEYGVADLRGRTDEECIAAMLAIADSRFQEELLREAKDAGKISAGYEIPATRKNNLPETLKSWLSGPRREGLVPAFPFGTDFTEVEQRLLPALSLLKKAQWSKPHLARLFLKGLTTGDRHADCLARMGFDGRLGLKERALKALVAGALAESEDIA